VLSEYEQRQLARIEQDLLADEGRWVRGRASFAGRLDERERRRRHHASAVGLLITGVFLIAASRLLDLDLLALAGVLCVFSSIVRWYWDDVRRDWIRDVPAGDPRFPPR
jgi:hypothetical protein